jgi:UDP-2,3-diacylglucosamine pyrophosphatase LpxH
MQKRSIDVVVISDVHLGTYGCNAKELLHYLQSINPKHLILNGDFIDGWQFSKRYFPSTHLLVLKEILKLMAFGCKVDYITGNHDEFLRSFTEVDLNNFSVINNLVIEIDQKKYWFFHGDIFDNTTKGSMKIIAKLGGYGYDLLIIFNRWINKTLELLGKEKMSLSKKVKNGIKKAVTYINNFEQTAATLAIEQHYDYVVCGHIHQPQIKEIKTDKGKTTYLNSGDWIENLTSLEYNNKEWRIFYYNTDANVKPLTAMPNLKFSI